MEDIPLSIRIGKLIRHLRQSAQLSQEAFATRCGLHRTYIGAIERGEKSITVETAEKLTKALNISLGQFFVLLEVERHLTN